MVILYPHQRDAVDKLRNGSILCGGVGSGKSITAIAYFFTKICDGVIKPSGITIEPKNPINLYIITTARKRDTYEWEEEMERFESKHIFYHVDSWNNIRKYEEIENSFFIFDEQRVIGSGAWAKSFQKIAKKNRWILLSATPGDTWMDYIQVFIANGFFKNKTEFMTKHAVYSHFSKYPKVDHYVGVGYLEKCRRAIMVTMPFEKATVPRYVDVPVEYDKELYKTIFAKRWDPYKQQPIPDAGQVCYILRKAVNSDPSRVEAIQMIAQSHKRIIIFYNYDYELDILRSIDFDGDKAEWNGHKHEPVPKSRKWLYFVQYTAGAEGWNCTSTNAMIFYSQSYSYKAMRQAAGRIDRLNTTYTTLYYYTLKTSSQIDRAIARSLMFKKDFNERAFVENSTSRK